MFIQVSTELLRSGYSVRFRPPGHSMHPTIRDGETVTVEPVNALKVKRGDILLYRTLRGLIAHRVIGIESKREAREFVMCGDAYGSFAETVNAEQVVGRVIRVERNEREINLTGKVAKFRQMTHISAARLKNALLPARRTEAI